MGWFKKKTGDQAANEAIDLTKFLGNLKNKGFLTDSSIASIQKELRKNPSLQYNVKQALESAKKGFSLASRNIEYKGKGMEKGEIFYTEFMKELGMTPSTQKGGKEVTHVSASPTLKARKTKANDVKNLATYIKGLLSSEFTNTNQFIDKKIAEAGRVINNGGHVNFNIKEFTTSLFNNLNLDAQSPQDKEGAKNIATLYKGYVSSTEPFKNETYVKNMNMNSNRR
jgi:hypothetical protein